MEYYILIFIADFLIAGQFSFNKLYERKLARSNGDVLILPVLAALINCLLFLCLNGFSLQFGAFSFGMAVLNAAVQASSMVCGVLVVRLGNVSVYTMFMMLGGMLLPYLYGVMFLRETPSVCQIVGLFVLIAALICVFVFFHFGLLDGWVQSVTAILIVFVIAFLFTTVAANAIAIVGTNPVSGMTLMTLILSSLVLVSVGLSGTTGMTAALIIGGVVCTALSMAGGFITDLKIGYWLGTTPRKQEAWKFLGTFVSAATVAGVMIILNKSFGFVGEGALVAPQANAMAAVIQPLMTGGQTPWMLYFCGAALALVLTAIGVPALAFALGMFISMELNAPLVVGGLVAWFVSTRSKDEALNKARFDRGTLIASGFIAGGALMGVMSAMLKFFEVDWFLADWASTNAAEWLGLTMYLVLIGYFTWHTLRAKKEE